MKNSFMKYSQVGLIFILMFAAIFYAGNYLDRTFKTLPLFTLLGILVGFGAAFTWLIKTVNGGKR